MYFDTTMNSSPYDKGVFKLSYPSPASETAAFLKFD